MTTIRKIKEKYDYNMLNKYCTENNITLTKDYSQEKINRDTQIEEKCSYENCNECYIKSLRRLINNGGAFCPLHMTENKQKKIKRTCLIKYGTESSMQNKEVKEKFKKTCLEIYGVRNPSQSEEIKEKKKQTCLINYGVEIPFQSKNFKEKSRQTCLEKYGVQFSIQNEEVKEKSRQTCLEKYGTNYPLQNADVYEKSSKNAYKLKDYTFPSGKIRKVQGYEPYALNEITQGIDDETDIITGSQNVPELWYDDAAGNKHRHYVDIYIPSQNKCIEIKSPWTFKKKQDNVLLKQEAGKTAGYNYEIWVYDGKGVKVECLV